MKNSLLFVVAILLFAGCKASTSPTGTTTTTGNMIATVNGSSWSSTVVPEISGGATGNVKNSALFVTGISISDNTEITIEIMNPKLGTDSLGASGDEGIYSKVLNAADTNAYASIPSTTPPYSIYNGAVTITQYDTVAKTISGTFNFVGRLTTNPSATVPVTNGSFYEVSW